MSAPPPTGPGFPGPGQPQFPPPRPPNQPRGPMPYGTPMQPPNGAMQPMSPPQSHPGQPQFQGMPPGKPPSRTGIWIASVVGVLIILSGVFVGTAFDPFEGEVATASDDDDSEETADVEDDFVDLTEGLEPFDPFNSDGYHTFTDEKNVFMPTPEGEGWEIDDYISSTGRSVYFGKGEPGDHVGIDCGDTSSNAEFYPDSFGDPEAWLEGQEAREAEYSSKENISEVVGEPRFERYLIDGHEAVLVEVEHHWSQRSDGEGGSKDVDFNVRKAHLYVDLGDRLSDPELPANTAGHCTVTSYEVDGTGYDEGLATILGVRF